MHYNLFLNAIRLKKCEKAVDTHHSTTKFVPECCKSKEMVCKAIHRCFFVFDSSPDQYKTQEICDLSCFFISFYNNTIIIIYCPDKYTTQIMCDEAIDDSLAALKLIPDWFVTSKII